MTEPRALGQTRSRLSRRQKWLVGIVVLVLAGFGLVHLHTAKAELNLPAAPVHSGEFLVVVKTEGSLIAQRSVQLTAPRNVPALQIVWLAPPGSAVKPGDPVIRFDPSTIQQQLSGKVADLRQAQAALDQGQSQARITAEQDRRDLAAAREAVERARLDASQQAILSAIDGAEKRIDLGTAEEKLRVEEATVNLHEKSSEAQIASLTRARDQAQYEVNLAQQRLAQLTITAPLNGIVTYMLNRSQGWMNAQPFKVGDQVWSGAAIAEIPDLSTLQMVSRLEEADRGRLKLQDPVRIHIDALPEVTFSGALQYVSVMPEESFGSSWPPVRTFRAYGSFRQTDARLRPDMNGSMEIVVQRLPNALSIPARALFTQQAHAIVYVRQGTGYRAIPVTVLARNPDDIAIAPLQPGELRAGAMVSLLDPAAARTHQSTGTQAAGTQPARSTRGGQP